VRKPCRPAGPGRAGAAAHAGQATAAHHALHGTHHLGQAAFLHLLHDGLHLRELVQQPVHVVHVHAGACGNAAFAAGFEQGWVGTFFRCHGVDDGFDFAHGFFSRAFGNLFGNLTQFARHF